MNRANSNARNTRRHFCEGGEESVLIDWDRVDLGQMTAAAGCYLGLARLIGADFPLADQLAAKPPKDWPWGDDLWIPETSIVGNLRMAGKLIEIETERRTRAAAVPLDLMFEGDPEDCLESCIGESLDIPPGQQMRADMIEVGLAASEFDYRPGRAESDAQAKWGF